MNSQQTPPEEPYPPAYQATQTPPATVAESSQTQRTPAQAAQAPAPIAQPRPNAVRSAVRLVLLVMMNLLFVFGLLLLVRLFLIFFRPLSTLPVYKPLISLTTPLVLPFGISRIPTPFGGFFEVNTAVSILLILVVEYLLGAVRKST